LPPAFRSLLNRTTRSRCIMIETPTPLPTPTHTYRFINADHTLVLRDDHVIEWNTTTNEPGTQHDPKVDETKLWKEAGSPTPQPVLAPPPDHFPYQRSMQKSILALNRIKTDLAGANDFAALKIQLQALTDAVI